MMTTNTAPQPVADDIRPWLRLAAELRTSIENGELEPGTPAPSITDLVNSGRARSRRTCAMALHSLADTGLLERRPGLGYYVAHRQRVEPDTRRVSPAG